MNYTQYAKPESYEPWQPPKSLQIIPYVRIDTCPTSYTPTLKPIKQIKPQHCRIFRDRIIEQYKDGSHSRLRYTRSARKDMVAYFIIKKKSIPQLS